MEKVIKKKLQELSKEYMEGHVMEVLPVDKLSDPKADLIIHLEEGKTYKGKEWIMRKHNPVYVNVPKCGNLRLFFFTDEDCGEWLIDYLVATGDKDYEGVNLFHMFNDGMIADYNEFHKEEREESGEPLLGDSIVEGCSAMKALGQEWKIVPRRAVLKTSIEY